MKKHLTSISLLALLCVPGIFAQEPAQISAPDLELKGNNILITYDILNSTRRDLFDIWIEVTDTAGNKIVAESLTGDVGENVKGGSHREIVWDLGADGIFLDAGIFIQVYGERLTPLGSDLVLEKEIRINPYKTIGQTLAFPGWGMAGMGKSKLHLLKGVAGYGCLAATIVYNRLGISNYDLYQTTEDLSEVDNYYNKAVLQDNLSHAFAYTAIAIWVAELTWTSVVLANIKKQEKERVAERINIYPVYHPQFQSPMLAVGFRF